MEKWKDIPGFKFYEASNMGRIRFLNDNYLVGVPNKRGKLTVEVFLREKKVKISIETLVTLAWASVPPENILAKWGIEL